MELHGRFAIYKGKEYKASQKSGKIILYSKNEEKGFVMNSTGTSYIKIVDKEEVERYYTKRMVGFYKTDFFEIIEDDWEKYTIYSPEKDYSLTEMGFECIGKGEYKKLVDKKEVHKVDFEYENLL